ncbi:hypothetical protein SSX86_013278 [Deinandra increscens subsp. villosa]|uniref:TIR domain-containing protein n=1 Tax=Deinandra increscens subsp. villosa TaxID=3103831 RepID=A0AAP0H2A2_9ASTR
MVTVTDISQPSSSSSTTTIDYEYDVFLSFRGLDTRLSFISHLHKALVDANLTTFLDNEEIQTGESMKPGLERAIKSSRVSITVLSQNYASSTWCLDELVAILDQRKKFGQIVIPIFFHVKATDVRKQQGSFGEAMREHRSKMDKETDAEKRSRWGQRMEVWKSALTEVAGLKGEDAKDRLETELIEKIVKDIYHILGTPLRISLPLLIGMDNSVKFITSWLKDGSSHTGDVLTILGMGGIGKTTLAKYFYGLHCHEYRSSFIEDIGRRCAELNGTRDVQKQLCDDISKKSLIRVDDVSVYTSKIEEALAHEKVLLVLDDVDSLDQLDALFGEKGFHSGSKIIITTKDASLTERCALFKAKAKPSYTECTLKGLSASASMELLCLHAFTSNCPNEDYKDVSGTLARYCEGHPLALKVLGKSLYKRSVREWKDFIDRLKKQPNSHIEQVLKMSFDSLPDDDKNLFKHIACFFVGTNRDFTETILNACNISTNSGINNLIDKCLLSIGVNNNLIMHRLLQEMGRGLVRKESPEKPWKRSRIWCHEESFQVLKRTKDTEDILGLTLDIRMLKSEKLDGSLDFNTDALSKMESLMLLQLNYVQIKGSCENFPEELRWLCMHGSPLKSIPSNLRMEKLVVFDMSYSKIESFGMHYGELQPLVKRQNQLIRSSSKGKPLLGSLKILVMSFCKQLCSLHGFFEFPLLERLIIPNCTSLIQVCESIQNCDELVFIDMSNCKKLKKLPRTIGMLKKVKTILLNGCDLSVFPTETRDMDSLQTLKAGDVCRNSQTSSSVSVEVIPTVRRSFMNSLPMSLVHLSLMNNNLSNNSFPPDFSSLSLLKKLCLDGNPIVSMPNCVRSLPRLEILSMRHCEMLETVEHPPSALRVLTLGFCSRLRKIIFDEEMAPLSLRLSLLSFVKSSFVIEGMVKIQPLDHVEHEVLCSIGWVNLEVRKYQLLTTPDRFIEKRSRSQMYYEFGIFSTTYEGNEMPTWISYRSKGQSISFTIPSSPYNLRGLNFCCVLKLPYLTNNVKLPTIIISNITKERTWIYNHCVSCVNVAEKSLIFLTHWMFGKNEMEDGDQIVVSVAGKYANNVASNVECGVGLVFDDGRMKKDVLGYYKSWNHIIGGDLSAFQTTAGEYILSFFFFMFDLEILQCFRLSVAESARSKGERIRFRAFSQQKYDELCGAPKEAKDEFTLNALQQCLYFRQLLHVFADDEKTRSQASKLAARLNMALSRHYGQEDAKEMYLQATGPVKDRATSEEYWEGDET